MDFDPSSRPAARAPLVGRLAGRLRRPGVLGQRTAMVLACKVVASAMILGANVLMARMAGVTGYGELSYILTVVNIATAFAVLGFPGLTIREIAYFHADGDGRAIRLRVRDTLVIVALGSLLAVAGTLLFLDIIGYPTAGMAAILAVGVWIIPANALLRVGQAVIQGLDRAVWGVVPEFLVRPSLLLLSTIGLWLWMESPQPASTLVILNLVSYLVAGIAVLVLIVRLLPVPTGPGARKSLASSLSEGLPFFFVAFLNHFNLQVPVLLLGNLADAEAVGLYRPATLLAETLSFILLGMIIPLRSFVAKRFRQGRLDEVQRQITLTTRITFLVAVSGFLAFLLLGELFLGLFGPELVVSYTTLIVLCLGQIANVAFGPVVLVLNMTGNARYTMLSIALGLAVNLALGAALVPALGPLGAAIGASSSFLVWNLVLSILAYRKTGIVTSVIGRRRPITTKGD